ncbi:MAG: single-stranded DNA-binding protein, partial [Candidatus Kuenenia stuttgartiensis]|nr:single-stranded DNA-binding protein [Candidatus Kuenenia stuttgartiensis]
MASLNKVFLMGNLTRDPELRYTAGGLAVASFAIAVSSKWTSKTGEQKDEVCFVDVSMFGRRAEVIGEYFSKGSPIFI